MLRRLKDSFRPFTGNLRPMLFFLFLYHALYTLLCYSLFRTGLSAALKARGYSYLTLSNILPTLFQPVSGVFLLLLFFLSSFFICLEVGVLLVGFQSSLTGQKISLRQMLTYSFLRFFRLMRLWRRAFQHLYLFLPLIAYHIASNLFLLYRLGFKVNPYSTFVPMLATKAVYYVPLITGLLLLVYFALRQVFSFFFWFLGGRSLRESLRAGSRLWHDHRFLILFSFVAVNALTALIWLLLRSLSQVLLVLAVHVLAPNELEVALVLSVNTPLSLLVLWVSSVLSIYLNLYMLIRLYYHLSREDVTRTFLRYRHTMPARMQHALGLAFFTVSAILLFHVGRGFYSGALTAERPLTPVQIICHRGLSSEAPENTLPAIDAALDALANGVEIDVQMTKDGVIVLSHDTNTRRMSGKAGNIADMTYEELLRLDFGSTFGETWAGTPIATLEEAMDLIKGRGFLIIDLKRNTAGNDLADRVVALIEEYDMTYQCAVQSTDYRYMSRVRELNPDITIGYILTAAIGNYYKNELFDYFCVRSMFVNSTTVTNAHSEGKAIYAWTINTRAEMERMKRAQVDAVITDYPARAAEVIYREGDVETILHLLRLVYYGS